MDDDPRIKRVLKRYRKGDDAVDAALEVSGVDLDELLAACGGRQLRDLLRPRHLTPSALAFFARRFQAPMDDRRYDYYLHSYLRREYADSWIASTEAGPAPAPEDGPPASIPRPAGTRWLPVRPRDGEERYEAWPVSSDVAPDRPPSTRLRRDHRGVRMHTRVLTPEDAAAYQALRLQALRECPQAFSASVEEESARSTAEVAARLAPRDDGSVVTLGAFDADRLCGFLALLHPQRAKLRHGMEVAGTYVAAPARRRGVARALLARAVQHAAATPGVCRLTLAVAAGNPAARALYEAAGFRCWGTAPEVLQVDGRFHDLAHYSLRVDAATGP